MSSSPNLKRHCFHRDWNLDTRHSRSCFANLLFLDSGDGGKLPVNVSFSTPPWITVAAAAEETEIRRSNSSATCHQLKSTILVKSITDSLRLSESTHHQLAV
ncbi:hypothetical protein LWI28_021344 [Acer negundo]|uniref:Uncharacterized protein n=1 Tax=Acer negundo TaxID=4023 RepID=A0AAD5J609_ACENE|nr:hypothetical protein LWI28_021344 [Acer negundo]